MRAERAAEDMAAEDTAANPVDEAAVGGTDQVLPVLVDVLAEAGAGLGDLATDREVEEVIELLGAESLIDKAELAVLQHVIGARLVIPSAGRFLIHELKPFLPAQAQREQVHDLADHRKDVPVWAGG